MKTLLSYSLLFFSLTASAIVTESENTKPLTEAEAMAIVKAREEAREAALDKKESELLNADISQTAVADLGYEKIILNRVTSEKALQVNPNQNTPKKADLNKAAFFGAEGKERINITLSGTVREGISELWWRFEGHNFKIFTNANFLWFQTFGERIEDEDTIYSIFPIIAKGHKHSNQGLDGEKWHPTKSDFTEGELEYFVVQSSGDRVIDEEAFKPILLILEFYSENIGRMKVSYENAEKMRTARDAYLGLNPRKKRDVIINSAPIDKSTR